METNKPKKKKDLSKLFKSYYVVWKLIIGMGYLPKKMMFKSYYVVWKLPQYNVIFSPVKGLNRTMQYGNYINIKTYK